MALCVTVPCYFLVLSWKKRKHWIQGTSWAREEVKDKQYTVLFTYDSAWLHVELWRATFTTLHLHPYVSIYCMLSPSTQEVIFLITTSYHNDWYSQCYIYQEAGKASVVIRCHQHSQSIQTDFSQHIRLQLHKNTSSSLVEELNTQSIILSVSSLYLLCPLTVHRY